MANWVIDNSHSEVKFKVKHLKISTVTGYFHEFSGDVKSDDDSFTNASVEVNIQAASINSKNDQRDGHLKSPDFFDVENNPVVTFKSENFSAKSDSISGLLTIKGISKNVTLDLEYAGTEKDPWGNTKAGFTLAGKINRTDFGLNWNAALETGGVLVSEEVKLEIDVQLLKQ